MRSPALEAKGQKLNRVRYDLHDRRRDSASRVSTNDAVDAVQNNKTELLNRVPPKRIERDSAAHELDPGKPLRTRFSPAGARG